MSDRLEEIKHKWETPSTDADGYFNDINESDVEWLISELQECGAEIKEFEDQVKWLRHIWRQEREEIKELKGIIKGLGWKEIKFPEQKRHQFSLVFQRKHRKWALYKMQNWRGMAGIFEAESKLFQADVEFHYAQAERFKARCGELLSVIEKHGISL